ncbi:acyl carrier protein [Kitasatospora sp. NPDC056327]|uniref:acyl carrier protein n=1 Tax=Kitasatospora sp. NPDC056327 TaxID=3345785 RepID=UPI0035DE3F92
MTTSDPATGSREDRKAQIKDTVCRILELDPEQLTDTSLFKEEHDADSLRAIEILAALERQFDITIEQDELARMVNLDGVESVVDQALLAR